MTRAEEHVAALAEAVIDGLNRILTELDLEPIKGLDLLTEKVDEDSKQPLSSETYAEQKRRAADPFAPDRVWRRDLRSLFTKVKNRLRSESLTDRAVNTGWYRQKHGLGMLGRTWEKRDDDHLLWMKKNGFTDLATALDLDRSPGAVRARLNILAKKTGTVVVRGATKF